MRSRMSDDTFTISEKDYETFYKTHSERWPKFCNNIRGELINKCKTRYFRKFFCVCLFSFFDNDTLTLCFFSELIDDKKETSTFFSKDFADALMEGRNKESIHYMNLFYFFGDFFCSESQTKREKLVDCILKDKLLDDLISVNMEALMVTVLHTGCGNDWPEYLNSKAYNDFAV